VLYFVFPSFFHQEKDSGVGSAHSKKEDFSLQWAYCRFEDPTSQCIEKKFRFKISVGAEEKGYQSVPPLKYKMTPHFSAYF